jgi:hypothetical protein
MFVDKDVSLKDVKEHWDSIILKISNCEGPYKVYTCFGTLVGCATSRQLVDILGVNISSISTAAKRGTYLKTFKIVK